MSTGLKFRTKSTSSDSTEKIAAQIGKRLKGGEVIELSSDLGGGKTVFARGLTYGAGSTDEVTSPTFTISKVYKAPAFEIYHFDFYRLADAGIVAQELHEIIGEKQAVTLVEWAGIVEGVLPNERLTVKITAESVNDRLIEISYPSSLSYLMEDLKR